MTTAPLLTAMPSGDTLELRPGGSWTAANAATLERLSDDVAPQLDQAGNVKVDMAGVRELDTLGAWLLEKMSRRVDISRSPCRNHRRSGQLCRPDRGGSSGQPPAAGAGAGAQSGCGEARRHRPRHHRRERGRDRIPADAGLAVHRHSRRAAPAAIAAADVAGLPALPGRLAGDPDHGADHLPDRRHHRAAGYLPFPQVRRRFLCRRHGRHSRAARTRRADRRHHGRRPFRAAPTPPNSAR